MNVSFVVGIHRSVNIDGIFLKEKYSRNVQAAARVAVHNVLAHNVPFLKKCFWNKKYVMKLIFLEI